MLARGMVSWRFLHSEGFEQWRGRRCGSLASSGDDSDLHDEGISSSSLDTVMFGKRGQTVATQTDVSTSSHSMYEVDRIGYRKDWRSFRRSAAEGSMPRVGGR